MDITTKELRQNQGQYVLVDVREPQELIGPEGCIQDAILATLGPMLDQFLSTADSQKTYVFICRSGVRSARATDLAHKAGLSAYNMKGGMIEWNS